MSKQRPYLAPAQARDVRALARLSYRPAGPDPLAAAVHPLYNLVLACLPVLRDLEESGIGAQTIHLSQQEVTLVIDPPPDGLIQDWCYVAPPLGMPRAPVTCRAIIGHALRLPVAVEWQALPRRAAGGR